MTATAGSLPKDNNFVSAIGAVSSVSDTGASLLPLQYNPSTRGLTVHIVGDDVGIGGSGGLTDAELRASAVPVSLASVPSHAVTNAGTFAVQATLAAETTKVIGTVNVSAGQTIGVTGTFWQATQPVSLASVPSHAVTNAGTFAVQVDGAALTALQLIDNFISGSRGLVTEDNSSAIAASLNVMDDWDNTASDGASVTGDVAHDDVDAGEPVKIGYKAIAHGANPTAVAAADRTNGYANRHGVPFMITGHMNPLTANLNVTDADGAQTNAAIITVSAGSKIVVTWIKVTADGANSGDTACRIGFGAANTPASDAAGLLVNHPGIKPGSGEITGNGGGILGVGGDGEDLRVTCEDPAGGALDILVGYYTIES